MNNLDLTHWQNIVMQYVTDFGVKIIAANGVDTLYGYAERESELGKWLTEQLDHTRKGSALSGHTFMVSFPENAQSDQCVLINRVLVARWLTLDN